MRSSALVLALFTFLYLHQALAGALDFHCSSKKLNGVSVKYCINDVDRTRNQDIIYFFHGLSASEKYWFRNRDTLSLAKSWLAQGYEPTVITVSLGPVWMLVDNSRYHYLPLFRDQVMPFLESEVGGLKQGRRMIIGQSMGGFNAVQLTMRLPGVFERALLLCPALTIVGPYAPTQDVDDYIKRTHAEAILVKTLIDISKQYILDAHDWDIHNPMKLPETYVQENRKPLYYVSTGRGDNFGFQEGSQIFANTANKYGFQAQWAPVFGYHCSFNRQGAADFIRGVSR